MSAVRRHRFVDDLSMPLGLYHFLGHQHFAAHGAVLPCRQAGMGAVRFNRRIRNFGMALGVHNSLRHQHFVADGTVFPRRQPGVGTVRFNRRVYHFGMALGVHNSLRHQHFIADGAVFPRRQAGVGAVRFNRRVYNFGVTQGIHRKYLCRGTVFAFESPRSCRGAVRSLHITLEFGEFMRMLRHSAQLHSAGRPHLNNKGVDRIRNRGNTFSDRQKILFYPGIFIISTVIVNGIQAFILAEGDGDILILLCRLPGPFPCLSSLADRHFLCIVSSNRRHFL